MLFRSLKPCALLAVLAVLFMVSVPFGAAQDATDGREPTTITYAMSGDEWDASNSTADPEGSPVFQLVEGGSGTSFDPACEELAPGLPTVSGTPKTTSIFWVANAPITEYPITPMNQTTITLGLGPAADAQSPMTTGTVTFEVTFGWIIQGANFHHHGEWTATESRNPTGGTPPGVAMTSPVELTVDFAAAQTQIAANDILFLELQVTCDARSSFTVETGSFDFQYVIGSPDDSDTDGDGIPDAVDPDDDGDGFTDAVEQNVGSDPQDGTVTPESESAECPGYTYQEVVEETGDPSSCPEGGGIPWVLILLILVALIVLGAAGYAGMMLVNRGIKMTVSHDGFQSIERAETATYDLTLSSTAKEGVETPVVMELKGVPEDWSATLSPDTLKLKGGPDAEPETVLLTVIPPAEAEYEEEAQITVTATPTDEEGKTSALKPGASVKTKTIVNIGVTPPEGEGKKKKKKAKKGADEEGAAEAGEEGAKKKGLGGLLGRKKKAEGEEEPAEAEAAEEEGGKKKGKKGGLLKRKKKDAEAEETEAPQEEGKAETGAATAGTTAAGAGAAAGEAGKPKLAMGKMVHDPASFSAGDEVTTTVPVSNKGDDDVSDLRLSLFVNDERVAHEMLDLSPGEKKEVVFKWTARPDENRVRVKGDIVKKGA